MESGFEYPGEVLVGALFFFLELVKKLAIIIVSCFLNALCDTHQVTQLVPFQAPPMAH